MAREPAEPAAMAEQIGHRLRVPFGRLGEKIVAPTEALARGLGCGCECPGCGTKLVLKQGKKRRHFAHYNAPALNRCVEQSIHSAAIQILLDAKYMPLPALHVEVSKNAADGTEVKRSHTLRQKSIACFDECCAEVTFSGEDYGTIRADVVGYRQERQLLVEMWFTHAVDADKQAKIERLGLPAVEIYLGDVNLENGFADIEERVLGNTHYKSWLFHPDAVAVEGRLRAEVEAEIARRNERHAREQEAQRRRREEFNARLLEAHRLREAEKLARQEALAEEARRKQAEAQARYERYRARPLGEKLVQVRRRLGMQGTWPPFLRFENKHNRTVAAPNKLWQAAVFRHFIFGAALRESAFHLHDAIAWVRNWFGELPSAGLTLEDAVVGFLAHLVELGFLAMSGTVGYGVAYIVLHNDLSLPEKPPTTRSRTNRLTTDEFAAVGHLNNQVEWSPTWPDYESVKRSVTKWISRSQKDELALLEALFTDRQRLPTPVEFTMQMRKHMPVTLIFDFLRKNGFVR